MSIKKSIMLSDETVAYINSRHRAEDGELRWSAAVNGAVDTLRQIIRPALPTLPMPAWLLLLNAHCGHFFDWRPVGPLRLASDIMDDLGVLSLDELDAETGALIRQIHGLSQIEQLAVFEVIKIYWANTRHECSLSEQISACVELL